MYDSSEYRQPTYTRSIIFGNIYWSICTKPNPHLLKKYNSTIVMEIIRIVKKIKDK